MKCVCLMVILFSALSFAKTEKASNVVAAEIITNVDVQKCYSDSPSAKNKITETVNLSLALDPEGKASLKKASEVGQTQDLKLKKCVEDLAIHFVYAASAKVQKELNFSVVFPAKK